MKLFQKIGLGIAAVLGARYLYNTSQETKAFDYSFAGINFKRANWGILSTAFDLELVMKIINPSNVTITIDELFLQVYLKGTKIGELIQNNLVATVESKDVTFIKLPFSTENLITLIFDDAILQQIKSRKIPDKLQIKGTVKVRGISKFIDETIELYEPSKNLKGTDNSKEIANEILRQLGGYNKLNAMLGLKDCMINGNGISFKIKASKIANYIKIQLNDFDLYDVEIGLIRASNYTLVKSVSNVYVDMLKNLIEQTCKVYLSL